jgi:hypothetical protein
MRGLIKGFAVALAVATTGFTPLAPKAAGVPQGTTGLQSIGPLAFGPNDVLFAADTQGATIYALELGAAAKGAPRGRRTCPGSIRRLRPCSGPNRPPSP